jgi:small subunit ribosomal protein S17
MTQQASKQKVRVGKVVSDKMDKTVVIVVERRVQHRLYHKTIRHISKFKAHDEANTYKVGDVVRIVETRPLSLTKRWRVLELVSRADSLEALPEMAVELPPEPEGEASKAAPRPKARTAKLAQETLAEEATEETDAVPVAEVEEGAPLQEPVAEAEEEAAAEEPVAEAEEEAPAEEADSEPEPEEKPEPKTRAKKK